MALESWIRGLYDIVQCSMSGMTELDVFTAGTPSAMVDGWMAQAGCLGIMPSKPEKIQKHIVGIPDNVS